MIKKLLSSRLLLGGFAVVSAFILGVGVVAFQPTPQKASAARSSWCFKYMYNRGDRSTCVEHIQSILRVLPSYPNLAVDGIFGYYTDKAVRAFQTKERISADGIVGPITWDRLCDPHYAKPDSRHRAAWEYRTWLLGC